MLLIISGVVLQKQMIPAGEPGVLGPLEQGLVSAAWNGDWACRGSRLGDLVAPNKLDLQ